MVFEEISTKSSATDKGGVGWFDRQFKLYVLTCFFLVPVLSMIMPRAPV